MSQIERLIHTARKLAGWQGLDIMELLEQGLIEDTDLEVPARVEPVDEENLVVWLRDSIMSPEGPASDHMELEICESGGWDAADNVLRIDGTIELEQLAGELLHAYEIRRNP